MTPADIAKSNAWLLARTLAQGDRQLAASSLAEAERAVIRRIMAATLPGGDAEFWRLVEEELTVKL